MNKAIQLLFEEHAEIVTAVDLAKEAGTLLGVNDTQYEKTIRSLLYFFRKYADEYHHQKEELVLFPAMAKKNEMLKVGVLAEMFDNHETFREMLRNIENLLEEKNYENSLKQLMIYCENLLDHIAVENEEVFQMADSLFNEKELESIFFSFQDCDTGIGNERKCELVGLVSEIKKSIVA